MIPLRSGTAQTASAGFNNQAPSTVGPLEMATNSAVQSHQIAQGNQLMKKGAMAKQRAAGAATSQGLTSQGQIHLNSGFGQPDNGSGIRQESGQMQLGNLPHNQTAKIPQSFLNANFSQFQQKNSQGGMMPINVGNLAPSALSMNADKGLSTSQKKRISLKKLEEEYCKTIEQICSPNSSTLNLENMKKTQSLHFMRAGSGASSPQQVKSRTSIGKYNAQYGSNPPNNVPPQRNSFPTKQQMAGPQSMPSSALGTGSRSRSKTTNRKKRNLYTSMGNYYQSQQPSNNPPGAAANSASRATKRVAPQNFLENLEQTNLIIGGNLAAAHNMLLQEDILSKKRNKSSTKSYNNKEPLDHNNSSEICYSSHLTKMNPMTNNFLDVSQFSSNHNSIAKNFENSFQFSAGGFLPNSDKPYPAPSGNTSLTAVSASKQRPASSHKSALMTAAASVSNNALTAKPIKKKASGLRKSVNQPPGSSSAHYTTNNNSGLINHAQNLQQNAYDFLSNASLFATSGKAAARRTKGGNSAIDSRCSQTKDHSNALSAFPKSQVASNTAFGHLNNTSHTTICSNRKQGGEVVSGKKNSLQQQLLQSNYLTLAGQHHNSDMLTAGEISSDRQTLKMNDFLKQIEAYSNEKLDKFMPAQIQGAPPGNFSQQVKVAEQVKNIIDREMSMIALMRNNSSKQRYPNDESRGADEGDYNDETLVQPDYEHLLNVISEGFNQLIATFYQSGSGAMIGVSLARVKESYEEIINSIVENLSQQIESLQGEVEVMQSENEGLRNSKARLEKQAEVTDKNTQQVVSISKQNEVLSEELNRLYEENKHLKKEQKERDSQLMESRKLIEQLSASQKQLMTNGSNFQSSGSAVRLSDLNQQSSKGFAKLSSTSVPPLDLTKLKLLQQQHPQPQVVQPLMSNDSLQTLDKALLNANIHDQNSQSSSAMNTVPHHEGSRMLEELYNNHPQQPFNANQSEISYQNSEEEGADAEASYLNSGVNMHNHIGAHITNQSGRLSSIAQDKSPVMKPVIPPLNLNGLNHRTQAARQGAPANPPPPAQAPPPIQKPSTKFKLDLNTLSQQAAQNQVLDQDSSLEYQKTKPQQPTKVGLGLNLAGLKQQKGAVDFQDEFMAKQDEFSESWREALKRDKRF